MDNVNKINGVNNKSSKAADKSAEDQLENLLKTQFNAKMTQAKGAKPDDDPLGSGGGSVGGINLGGMVTGSQKIPPKGNLRADDDVLIDKEGPGLTFGGGA